MLIFYLLMILLYNHHQLYHYPKLLILLLRTIDKIKPGVVNWKIVDKKANNPFKKTVNCNEVIDASKKI